MPRSGKGGTPQTTLKGSQNTSSFVRRGGQSGMMGNACARSTLPHFLTPTVLPLDTWASGLASGLSSTKTAACSQLAGRTSGASKFQLSQKGMQHAEPNGESETILTP
eukprot:GHVN01049886.1.p2 GENE.GHVN01049886.1~~GHVN01049886.1.p2  ORF type:complete len:108 (-),score=1.18 GHVN01049886.1:4-327(-)